VLKVEEFWSGYCIQERTERAPERGGAVDQRIKEKRGALLSADNALKVMGLHLDEQ
jgi:hypothetical protein